MNSRLRSVISETSRGLKTSLYLALPVEIISNFQIILVIFNNIFSSEIDKSDFHSRFTSFITSNIGSFDFLGVSSGDNAIIEAIWICIILYFAFHLLLIIFAIITYSNQPSARKRRLLNMISIMFLLHSRVIFFFLHYFLMGFISSYINCDGTDTSFECQVGGMAVSIVLILINFAFGLVKELLLYDINKNKKNPNAIKTNLFHTMTLLHKALAIALYFLLQDPSSSKQVNIAVNICLLFVSVAILYIKFPFYNFTMLRASVMTTGVAFGFAAVSIAGVTDLEDSAQTILWITSAPLIMKSALLILNRLSDRIMNGEFDSPEKAIHFVMRLNAHNFGYVPKSLYPLSTSHVSVIVSNGMFVQKKLNMNAIKECKSWKEYEEMIYSYILDRLNPILEKNPTSELLLLFIARIYFKKLENIPKALMLIKRVESSRLSIPLQNSIEAFNVKFMETQMRDSHDNRHDNLYVIEYFKERALSNLIKEEIQYEIQKHLEFWDAIRKDRTNVIRVIDISYQIEEVAIKIQNRWQNQIKGTIKHFLNSLIMYGAYLDIIKEHADEAKKLIQRYWNLSHNPHQDQALDVYSEEAAVVLVTIEKTNFGVISDASGSAQSLFRREKQKLIGQNLTSLVPSMVGENLLALLDKYAKKPTGRLNYSLKSYGKTGTGEFFEADIHLKLFPEISRQVKIMIIFQKLAVAKPIMIVDDNGNICEYTQGLRQLFNFGESSMSLVNMQKIAPEFPRINDAFNHIYNSNAHIQENSTIIVTSQSPARVSHTRHLATEEKGYKQTHESHKERRKSVSANKLVLLDDLAQDQYKRVCNEFVQGSKLRFVSVSGSAANIDEAEVDVQITPLEMNEELYKIIVLNFSDEKEANAKLEVKESQTADLEELFSDFAAEFPEADEREGKGGHKKKNLLTSKVSKYREENSGLERRFTRFTEERESEDVQKIPSKLKSLGSLNAMNVVVKKRGATTHDEMFEMAKVEMREGSVSSTSSRTVASIRALKNLFNKSQSYTLARRVRIAIFAIMLFMAILAVTNFILSRNAVSSVKTGVNLINIASLRLEQSMRAWQFAVRFFLRKIGLRSGQIQSLKDSSYTAGNAMLLENKLLYEELSEQVDPDLFNDIMADDINLWIPYENKTIDGKQSDTFTATNVLATKILFVANTSDDINAPKVLEQIQFVANNSGNDFLISSEDVITSTQKMLKKLISKNISNLQLVLILQIVAIVLLCLCLIIALRVIMQSYRILFRALVKIDEKSVTHRIQQIHRIKTLFQEDIDTKKFGSTAVDILRPMDGDSVKVKAKAHKTGFHIIEERIQMRGLLSHLIKHVGFSLLVIQVITILFIVALTKSIANFRSLDNVNNQLSVTTQVAYETSAIISTFYVEMVWRNDTTMLVRNELPRVQVPKGIDALTNVNQDLVAVFTDEDGISDPLIKDIFQSTVCKYLSNDTTTQTYCENATQTGTIGILAINSQFYLTAQFYSAMYFANPTWANAKSFIDTYILTMRPCAETLESAYEFINAHILDGFNKTISNFNKETTVLHVGILIAVLFSTIVIQKVCVNRLGLLDMRRGIILRAISFQILLQDKAISFYLNRHFISTNNALSKSL